MYSYLGDYPTGATIFFPFHTFNSSGASVTLTGLAVTDIEVYKGASMTQRSSDAGYALVDTDGIDLDGVTGIHGFTIDTSDNTDAGFYAAGNDYTVVVSSVTVDSQTVNFIVGRFSIDNRGLLRPTTAQRTLDVTSTGAAGIDLNNVELPVGAIPSLGIIDNGTLQSATASTAVLRAAAALGDDTVNNSVLEITGGTGAGQVRLIVDYVTATDTATVNPDWTTNPDNTSTYIVRAAPPAPTSASYQPSVLVSVGTGTGQINLSSGKAPATIAAGDVAAGALTASALAADAVDEILDEQLTDSVPADGTIPTVRQALYMLTQFMFERSVSGTTLTVRKADGSTSLMTFTLDDGTSPTSITRAT
jgi:hypothetical protein